MSVYLLDVNVLIALFDPAHVQHEAAHRWLEAHRDDSWATCPLTENGFLRIISNPGYPSVRTTLQEARARLDDFIAASRHVFWPDDISFRDATIFRPDRVVSSRQLTDVYLLGLCVKHQGRLATFDGRITSDAIVTSPRLVELLAGSVG